MSAPAQLMPWQIVRGQLRVRGRRYGPGDPVLLTAAEAAALHTVQLAPPPADMAPPADPAARDGPTAPAANPPPSPERPRRSARKPKTAPET